jgi:hypothetical protein
MDWARDLALLLTAVGGTYLVPRIVAKAWQGLTGRSTRRRNEADQLRDDLDKESAHRRILQESISVHRRVIIEASCLTEDDLPPYPTWTHKE